MSINRTFPKWRDAERLDLLVPAGTQHRIVFVAKGPEFKWVADFFSTPLDLDDFATGPSDYDTPSDEVYCPCGATLPDWDGTAGDLLRMIYGHCEGMAHPRPVFDR